MFRQLILLTLGKVKDLQVIGEFGMGKPGLEFCLREKPDMLVVDTGSAEFGTPDLAGRLRQRNPGLRIILVGMDDEDPFGDDLPPRTAYVSKHSADESLLPAARALLQQNGSSRHTEKSA